MPSQIARKEIPGPIVVRHSVACGQRLKIARSLSLITLVRFDDERIRVSLLPGTKVGVSLTWKLRKMLGLPEGVRTVEAIFYLKDSGIGVLTEVLHFSLKDDRVVRRSLLELGVGIRMVVL